MDRAAHEVLGAIYVTPKSPSGGLNGFPNIILFPEAVSVTEMRLAQAAFPQAVLVAAVAEGRYCRGYIFHDGVNRVAYRKIGSDGRTLGVKREPRETPVWRIGDAVIGIVICMDVQTGLLRRVVTELLEAQESVKLLCIPADMGSEWFAASVLEPNFHGVCVALCNRSRTDGSTRCDSFVAGPDGRKIEVRQAGASLHVVL